MIEVAPHIWRIEIPLPRNPLRAVNSYAIKGQRRNLIIDTGMARPECRDAMRASLERLDIDLSRTDLFITHLHADHLGLVTDLACPGSTVYFNRPEAETVLNYDRFWESMRQAAARYGFTGSDLEEALARHPGRIYSPPEFPPFTLVSDSQEIQVGPYRLRCIKTPGHSPGHMCLYEADHGILFSGDHILGSITPNIAGWRMDLDALGDYLDSLKRTRRLEVELILPGHRDVIEDLGGRISELERHHRDRLEEVLSILQNKGADAVTVASQMTWDLNIEDWEQFPPVQKWFAVGEAIAHVEHLRRKGLVSRHATENGILVFER